MLGMGCQKYCHIRYTAWHPQSWESAPGHIPSAFHLRKSEALFNRAPPRCPPPRRPVPSATSSTLRQCTRRAQARITSGTRRHKKPRAIASDALIVVSLGLHKQQPAPRAHARGHHEARRRTGVERWVRTKEGAGGRRDMAARQVPRNPPPCTSPRPSVGPLRAASPAPLHCRPAATLSPPLRASPRPSARRLPPRTSTCRHLLPFSAACRPPSRLFAHHVTPLHPMPPATSPRPVARPIT
ncbi:hypothetical protein EVG20_g11500, partial [Dentipellis fragilis]